jgi:hypothetical protein
MNPWHCFIGWLAVGALCALLFWAAAVLAKRDDIEHGRD